MSINLPFFVSLAPYAIFLLIFVFFSLISLANLIRYSANDGVAFAAAFLFLAATMLVAFESWQLLIQFDWTKMVPINLPTLWPSSINI